METFLHTKIDGDTSRLFEVLRCNKKMLLHLSIEVAIGYTSPGTAKAIMKNKLITRQST